MSFWRKYGCEHSEIGFVSAIYCSNTSSVAVNRATFCHWRRLAKILAFVGAQAPPTPATHFSAGVQTMRARICSALSCDMFARVVWLKSWGAAKPPTFDLSLAACTRHAWLVRLTRARGRRYIRGRKALLYDFCRAFGHSKAREEKSYFMFLRGRTMFAPTTQSQSPINSQNKKSNLSSAFSFDEEGAKEKAIKKKTPK